jgi:hypothetical protein
MYCSKSKLNQPAPLPSRGFLLQPVALFLVALLGLVKLERKMEMERLHGGCGNEVDRAMV